LLKSDLLKATPDPAGEILYFDESRRRALDIYRNTIVHFLAAPSFMARLLLAGTTQKELGEAIPFWQELLYQEYFPPHDESPVHELEAFLLHSQRMGWIALHGGAHAGAARHWVVTQEGEPFMHCLEAQTRGVIEAYRSLIVVVLHAEEQGLKKKDLCKRASRHLQHANLLGEAARSEAANDTTFGNALDLLERRGMLRRSQVEGGRRSRDAAYDVPEEREALAALERRLARALSAR
jgi:glycerol-3-phosphate O-acyltransferase